MVPLARAAACAVLLFAAVVLGQAPMQLRCGLPSTLQNLDAGTAASFVTDVVMLNATGAPLMQISLTPISGDPDIFVYANGSKASGWNATQTFAEVIVIRYDDPQYAPGPFSIKVGAASPCVFLVTYVVAYTDASCPLVANGDYLDGVPTLWSTSAKAYTDFVFQFKSPINSSLSFGLTSLSGDPDLYVTLTNPPARLGKSTWSARSLGSDFLYISHDDPKYVPSGNYYAAVQGYSDTVYSFTASTEDQNHRVLLMEGFPHEETAQHTEFRQFLFFAPQPGDLRIVCEAMSTSSDPDVYVGLSFPVNATNALWKSSKRGSDQLLIPDSQRQGETVFYIGVYGYGHAAANTFRLTAMNQYFPSLLQNGEVTKVNVSVADPGYFFFQIVDSDVQLDVVVTAPNAGEGCMLFADLHNPLPSPSKSMFRGFQLPAGQKMHFNYSSLPTGTLFISVWPDASKRSSALCIVSAVTSLQVLQLRDNVPVLYNHVPQGAYRYFAFDVTDLSSTLVISMSPSSAGDPDLFAAYGYLPSRTNYTFASQRYLSDQIVISGNSGLITGILYISVYGFSDTSFSITAYSANQTQRIESDSVVSGSVPSKGMAFFAISNDNPTGKTLLISLVSVAGDADLYVGFGDSYSHPDPYNYEYRSLMYQGDFIRIPEPDAGTYFIGVRGYTQASFRLLVVYEDEQTVIPLAAGFPINDHLWHESPVSFRQYYIFVPYLEDILLSVTPVIGSSVTYLQYDARANSTSNFLSLSHPYPGNVATLHSTDPSFRLGLLYVTVNSTSADPMLTEFTVMYNNAYGMSFLIGLQDGQPTLLRVDNKKMLTTRVNLLYPADGVLAGKFVKVSTAVFDGPVDVALSLTNPYDPTKIIAQASGDKAHFLEIPYSAVFPDNRDVTLYCFVLGKQKYAQQYTTFVLQITSHGQIQRLSRGLPLFASAVNGSVQLQSFPFPAVEGQTVDILLTSCGNYNSLQFSAGIAASPDGDPFSVVNVQQSQLEGYVSYLNYIMPAWGNYSTVVSKIRGDNITSEALLEVLLIDSYEHIPDVYSLPVSGSATGPSLSVRWTPTTFSDMHYAVFMAPVVNNVTGARTNLHTHCACENNWSNRTWYKHASEYTQLSDGTLEYVFTVAQTGFYIVNVVVRPNNGIAVAYIPAVVAVPVGFPTVEYGGVVPTTKLPSGSSAVFLLDTVPSSNFVVTTTPYVGEVQLLLAALNPIFDPALAVRADLSPYPGNQISVATGDAYYRSGAWFATVLAVSDTIFDLSLVAVSKGGVSQLTLTDGDPVFAVAGWKQQVQITVQVFVDIRSVVEVSVASVSGQVKVWAGIDDFTEANSLGSSSGPGSRLIVLGSEMFPARGEQTLYVTVVGAKNGANEFVIAVTSAISTMDLVRAVPIPFFIVPRSTRAFRTASLYTAEKLLMFEVDSCDNHPPPVFYLGVDQIPIPNTASAVQTSQPGPHYSFMIVQNPPMAQKDYYLAVYPASNASTYFNIRRRSSRTPEIYAGSLNATALGTSGSLQVTFSPVIVGSSNKTAEYAVFVGYAQVSSNVPTNLYTVCGCESQSLFRTSYLAPSGYVILPSGLLQLTVPNMPASTMIVNVVARSPDGYYVPYTPKMVSISSPVQPMFVAVPLESTIKTASTTQYFSFAQRYDSDFQVAVTPYYGIVSLCIQAGSLPDPASSTCDKPAEAGAAITMSREDPAYVNGQWFVSVTATSAGGAFFHLLVSDAIGGPIESFSGETLFSAVNMPDVVLYSFDISAFSLQNGAWNWVDFAVSSQAGQTNMDVYSDLDIETPLSANSSLAANLVSSIPASAVEGARYLYLVVQAGNTDRTRFVSVGAIDTQPVRLVESIPLLSRISSAAAAPRQFLAMHSAADTIHIAIDSCGDYPAPQFFTQTNQYASKDSYLYVSSPAGPYRSAVAFQQGTATPAFYYSAPYSSAEWQIISTSYFTDSDPVVTTGRVRLVAQGDVIVVTFPAATVSQTTTTHEPHYAVYIAPINDLGPGGLATVNFHTPCAVQGRATSSTPFQPGSSFINPETGEMEETWTDLDPLSDYVVNVVVRTHVGTLTSYVPLEIYGGAGPARPGFDRSHRLSGGSIFLIVLFSVLGAYFVFGSVINAARGKRGLSVVPNAGFWRDLPHLVADGYRFVTGCGASNYSAFDDRTGPAASTGAESGQVQVVSSSSSSSAAAEAPRSSTGYGTL